MINISTMNNKNTPVSRRDVLKTTSAGLMGIAGTSLMGSATASTKKYYAEYRCQRHGSLGTGLSKLQIRIEWDVESGKITDVSRTIFGRAGSIDHSFDGITTRESSGGVGETYYQTYAEGDYHVSFFGHNTDSYIHWMDMTVHADGSHFANCNWKKEFVGAGQR